MVSKGSISKIMCFCGIIFCMSTNLNAQSVYLSRFVPVNPNQGADTHHRVEIYNESQRYSINISGYVLVTRNYIVRLSGNLRIPPMRSIQLGRYRNNEPSYFAYESMSDFTKRLPAGRDEGDFAILYDRSMRIVDAFYFSDQRAVSFLPAQEDFITPKNERISIRIPDEKNRIWSFLQALPDPAMAFVKISGNWSPNSRRTNLFPATEYKFLQTKYVEGIITLKWKTLFENDCYYHIVERSEDGRSFREISRQAGVRSSSRPLDYIYYDTQVKKDTVYTYRLRNVDKFGNTIVSEPIAAITEENPGGFSFDIIAENSDTGKYLNLRFSAKERQRVRIKLLDEELRQLAILFFDTIEAEKQNLINYTEPLPYGIYHVLVETEERRYRELFIVE